MFSRKDFDSDEAFEQALRDYFAGQALAFLAHPARVGVSFHPTDDAEFAYRIADAMIAARTDPTAHGRAADEHGR